VSYQKERFELTDLEKTFDERNQQLQAQGGIDINAEHLKPKLVKGEQPEWQKQVKGKKNEEYYSKLQELESDQLLKEQRNREQSHQFATLGESSGKTSLARGMASQYESTL